MQEMDNKTGPPWGHMALEQYFITEWKWISKETPDQQRARLVKQFIDLQHIPRAWAEVHLGDTSTLRVPTMEEIDIILRPYRPDILRWHGYNMYHNMYLDHQAPVLLRTYYSTDQFWRPKHDKVMKEWADSDGYKDQSWWGVLDNQEYFDFGSNWRRIYDILPEVSNPIPWRSEIAGLATRGCSPEFVDGPLRSMFKNDIAFTKDDDPTAWHEKRDTLIESAGALLQNEVVDTYLFIADLEAFESNRLRLLYLDPFRNIVREGRLDAEGEGIGYVMDSWAGSLPLYRHSVAGDKYRVNGELGKVLYQLTEEDLADPK
ncbi:uncharacterized protein N7506_000678 [Penicillium brevicompactum]|uniref:uncharacterized protein n=1 Tax=Penicillium brevicompactum TaxID=5074 RepID=UPI00253F990F|nr:uncharacterized protein N7506_000678 [Penicillium brevicompactum]KAJ5347425.1 hypothetical protein N7506_000678 [Penicillium brevicompactum]